jgi:hypothetical protein
MIFYVSAYGANTPELIGAPWIHGLNGGGGEHDLYVPIQNFIGNTLLVGTTRCGKTRALELWAEMAISLGYMVIVPDPKGDQGLEASLVAAPLCQASCRLRNLDFKLRGYNEDEVFRGIYRTSASQAIDPWRPNDTNGRGRFERQLPYVEELDEKENGEHSWSIGSKREAPPGLGR